MTKWSSSPNRSARCNALNWFVRREFLCIFSASTSNGIHGKAANSGHEGQQTETQAELRVENPAFVFLAAAYKTFSHRTGALDHRDCRSLRAEQHAGQFRGICASRRSGTTGRKLVCAIS